MLKYDTFMVREVNPSVMDKAEKLSDNIYFYNESIKII